MKHFHGHAACALIATATVLPAQAVRTSTVGAPTATFAEPFSRVAGIREQSDGRVVVLDGIEAKIMLLDFRTATTTPIGRSGPGPAEYTLPIELVALAADTTLAVDMTGGGRSLVITRSGAATSPLRSARIRAGKPLFMRSDIQADAQGRLYELVPRVQSNADRQRIGAVGGVRRLDRQSGVQDTIGELSAMMRSPLIRPRSESNSAGNDRPLVRAGKTPPFPSFDQWAVALDGRIAFLTVDPYRVSFISATGERTEGPTLRVDAVKVNQKLKEHWRKLVERPVPMLSYGPNGMSPGRTKPTYVEPDAWPDVLPPFLPNAVRFAPDGTLWIERATAADQPQTFDVVDRKGALARRVVLPQHTRLVGFGAGTMYTVRIDDDDLEYLQRHRLPN